MLQSLDHLHSLVLDCLHFLRTTPKQGDTFTTKCKWIADLLAKFLLRYPCVHFALYEISTELAHIQLNVHHSVHHYVQVLSNRAVVQPVTSHWVVLPAAE